MGTFRVSCPARAPKRARDYWTEFSETEALNFSFSNFSVSQPAFAAIDLACSTPRTIVNEKEQCLLPLTRWQRPRRSHASVQPSARSILRRVVPLVAVICAATQSPLGGAALTEKPCSGTMTWALHWQRPRLPSLWTSHGVESLDELLNPRWHFLHHRGLGTAE